MSNDPTTTQESEDAPDTLAQEKHRRRARHRRDARLLEQDRYEAHYRSNQFYQMLIGAVVFLLALGLIIAFALVDF